MNNTLFNWLNDEPQTVILQRDNNTFAMLTWKDFNQQPEAVFTMKTAAWLFILGAGIPLLMLS